MFPKCSQRVRIKNRNKKLCNRQHIHVVRLYWHLLTGGWGRDGPRHCLLYLPFLVAVAHVAAWSFYRRFHRPQGPNRDQEHSKVDTGTLLGLINVSSAKDIAESPCRGIIGVCLLHPRVLSSLI